MNATVQQPEPNTHKMVVIHRIFYRELRQRPHAGRAPADLIATARLSLRSGP
jgi:hypothetical protein